MPSVRRLNRPRYCALCHLVRRDGSLAATGASPGAEDATGIRKSAPFPQLWNRNSGSRLFLLSFGEHFGFFLASCSSSAALRARAMKRTGREEDVGPMGGREALPRRRPRLQLAAFPSCLVGIVNNSGRSARRTGSPHPGQKKICQNVKWQKEISRGC